MGQSVKVTCGHCGFSDSAIHGVGMAGIEVVPCVCRRCEGLVAIERIPDDADESHIRYVEETSDVRRDAPFVCPDCAGPIDALLAPTDDASSPPVAVEPCPRCGEPLTAAEDYLLWD